MNNARLLKPHPAASPSRRSYAVPGRSFAAIRRHGSKTRAGTTNPFLRDLHPPSGSVGDGDDPHLRSPSGARYQKTRRQLSLCNICRPPDGFLQP